RLHERRLGHGQRGRRLHHRRRARADRARTAAVPDRGACVRMTRLLRGLGYYGLLAAVTVIALGPTLWVVASSFKTSGQIFTSPGLIPKPFTLQGYADAFG